MFNVLQFDSKAVNILPVHPAARDTPGVVWNDLSG